MADGYFETLRTYSGKPALLGAHLRRLQRALADAGAVNAPTIAELTAEVRAAVMAAGKEDLMIRVIVEPERGSWTRAVEIAPLPPHALAGGMALADVITAEAPGYSYPHKSTSRDLQTALLARATEAGADEALIVDGATVIEGTRTNVLLLDGDELVSPPEGRMLPGVTLEALMLIAPELGLRPTFREVTIDDLRAADEVFICNALIEVRRVATLDGQPVGGRDPSMHTRLDAALLGHYRSGG